MAAPPQMWEAFFEWCRNEIAERKEELRPLRDGSGHVGRGYQGQWVDITDARIAQIEREIASLENTIEEFKQYAPRP